MQPASDERFLGVFDRFGQLDCGTKIEQDNTHGMLSGPTFQFVNIFFLVPFLFSNEKLLEILELDVVEPATLFP
jgi:hypothetical protein